MSDIPSFPEITTEDSSEYIPKEKITFKSVITIKYMREILILFVSAIVIYLLFHQYADITIFKKILYSLLISAGLTSILVITEPTK